MRVTRTFVLIATAALLMGCGPAPEADEAAPAVSPAAEREALTSLLDEFLAGASVGDAAVHDRFWSEDLVYTSSSGTRRGKAEIMQGLRQQEEGQDSPPSVVYTAEDVEVDLYGETAVVAFRLIATPSEGSGEEVAPAEYFNTGTFLKRDGLWKVVAWQATRIPDQPAEQ